MSDNENKDGLDRFIRDERSPLAKMLEEKRVAHREFEFDGAEGRFAGKTFAVRALSAEERMRAVAEATRFLVNELKLEREDLYTRRRRTRRPRRTRTRSARPSRTTRSPCSSSTSPTTAPAARRCRPRRAGRRSRGCLRRWEKAGPRRRR
jgi:hypothetical protein